MEAGLISAITIIAVLEILRFFRENKKLITEVEELKSRINYLEYRVKEK